MCLLLVASLALTRAQSADPSLPNTNINEIDDKIPEKPEPRQIGAVMPYTWLQPGQGMGQAMAQVAQSAPAISSWGSSSPSWWSSLGSGQSFLSLFKPNVIGGRRSSLTSRLRNLMNALFYRWLLFSKIEAHLESFGTIGSHLKAGSYLVFSH